MRLLFLNYEFPPDGGGAGFATLALARELVDRGHEVEILTSCAHGGPGVPSVENIDGVTVHRVKARRRNVHDAGVPGVLGYLASASKALPRLVREGNFDVIHYYFGLPTALLSLWPGAHQMLPYVVSLRGSDVPGYDPKLTTAHKLLWPVTRRIWDNASSVVANSAGLRELAMRAGSSKEIQVIRNGGQYVPRHPAPRSGPMRVLAACRLIERKRVDTILQAMAMVRDEDIQLEVVGDGPLLPTLISMRDELGLRDRVCFHGFVSQEGLTAMRAASDVFVLASSSESCSMAVLEAICAGLPVIATAVGGTPELVHPGRNGILFGVGDAGALANALRGLSRNVELRQRLSAGSETLAREEFSWHYVARRYEMLFDEAVEHRRAVELARG